MNSELSFNWLLRQLFPHLSSIHCTITIITAPSHLLAKLIKILFTKHQSEDLKSRAVGDSYLPLSTSDPSSLTGMVGTVTDTVEPVASLSMVCTSVILVVTVVTSVVIRVLRELAAVICRQQI